MAVSKLLPTSNANDFNIQLTGPYVKVTLAKEYAAGAYSIVSGANDTSLDIYAFSAAGTLVASTSTKSLVTTGGFNKIVCVGGADGDVLSFTFKQTFTTTNATSEPGVPPIAVSTSPSALPNVDDSTTVSGYNFTSGMTASFVGTDAVARSAKSVIVGSSTSAIVTRPDVLPVSASPYDLSLAVSGTNPPVGSTVSGLENAITAGSGPSWTTTTPLPTFTVGTAYSTTLVATDPDTSGSIASYTVVSGTLPTGITLGSANGVLGGTPTTGNTAVFTVRATNQDGDFVDRAFTMPNTGPTWSTPTGNIDTGIAGDAYTFTLVATDDSGSSPTYAVTSGTLVTGLTLASNGVISGTIATSATASTFTVTASDANGSTAARSFTIPVAVPGTWSTVGTAATAYEATDAYGGVYNGFIYVGGGQKNGSPNTFPYTWQKVALGTGVATLLADAPQRRDEMGSIWVGNKHIVVNGYNENGSLGTYNTPMIYNDATNTWSLGATAPYAVTGLSHNTTDGTNVYTINNNQQNMYRYNVSANTWTTLAARDNTNCQGGRRMAYRASDNTIYAVEFVQSVSRQGIKKYNIGTNSWTYSTTQINRFYDSPWTSSDNYQMGYDLDNTGNFIYMYGYDQGFTKTTPSRANGGTPDRILKYDIVADTWTVTSFTDVGQCGNATGRVGRSYYSWGGSYADSGGALIQSRALRVTIL
jgi:hypothetical protein